MKADLILNNARIKTMDSAGSSDDAAYATREENLKGGP
jgi:hypothetical protein